MRLSNILTRNEGDPEWALWFCFFIVSEKNPLCLVTLLLTKFPTRQFFWVFWHYIDSKLNRADHEVRKKFNTKWFNNEKSFTLQGTSYCGVVFVNATITKTMKYWWLSFATRHQHGGGLKSSKNSCQHEYSKTHAIHQLGNQCRFDKEGTSFFNDNRGSKNVS